MSFDVATSASQQPQSLAQSIPQYVLYVRPKKEGEKEDLLSLALIHDLTVHPLPVVMLQDVTKLARPVPYWLDGTPLLVDRYKPPPDAFKKGREASIAIAGIRAAYYQQQLMHLQQQVAQSSGLGDFVLPGEPSQHVKEKYLQGGPRGSGISERLHALQSNREPNKNNQMVNGIPDENWRK